MHSKKTLFQLVFLALAISGFHKSDAQILIDVATDFGIEHTLSPSNFWGSGTTFFDFDDDGWDDLTLIQENDSLVLFKNNNGTPGEIPPFAFGDNFTKHALWVDFDNDGDYDLFLSSYEGRVRLYENIGDFTFNEITAESGLLMLNTRNYGISCADYDRDGFLDLYVCRYYGGGDPNNPAETNALYRNNGDGTFTNVTVEAGVGNGIAPSFQGVWIDHDHDGWPDLYVINDRSMWGNALYRNNGDGTFTDIAIETNTEFFGDDPMTATVGDFDNDGDLDIYMTNTGPNGKVARLARANSDGTYDEVAAPYGVNLNITAWGASFIDLDNNGFQDLFVTTAQLATALSDVRAYLYVNMNGQFFVDSPASIGSSTVTASYGVAKGDLNNDGFADLVVQTAKGYNAHILQNTATAQNTFAKITLKGTVSNTMAIGSWIHLYANGTTYVHYTKCGENYCGQNSQHHIFGLGQAQQIDSLTVWYPSGHLDTYYNLEINQHHTLTEGGSIVTEIAATDTHLCPGDEIMLQAFGGVYQVWNDGVITEDGQRTVSVPGAYSFVAYNALNIPAASDTIVITATESFGLDIVVTHPGCDGDTTGSVEIALTNPELSENGSLLFNGLPAGWYHEDLDPGNYVIAFITEEGCEVSETVQLLPTIAIETLVTTGSIDCYGGTTFAEITVFGANSSTIDWGMLDPSAIYAGNHTAIVVHNENCVSFVNFEIEQPSPVDITVNENNGILLSQVSGGTPPYDVHWYAPEGTSPNELPVVLNQSGTYFIHAVDANLCEAETSFEYTGTSVAQTPTSLNTFTVYPNPASTVLLLKGTASPGSRAVIFDMQGKKLHEEQLSDQEINPLDIAQLAAGAYLVTVIHPAGAKQAERLKFFKIQ